MNYLLEEEKIFILFLLHNLISLFQKMLNSKHYFVMKISNKRELQKIPFNHSSDIDFQDFMNLYKNVLQSHILFWWFMLLHVLKKIFQKEYNN